MKGVPAFTCVHFYPLRAAARHGHFFHDSEIPFSPPRIYRLPPTGRQPKVQGLRKNNFIREIIFARALNHFFNSDNQG